MIESIHIANIATYGSTPEVLGDLSRFNFLFGSNASGKTTISRVIADEGRFPSCRVVWKGNTKLQAMVYNRDFIARNFDQSTELKGIFTLGEKNLDTLAKIAAAKLRVDDLTDRIESLSLELHGEDGSGGKKGELETLEIELKDTCWAQKQKHDASLSGAFEGFRNNAERFKDKLLQEWASNSATLESLADLEKRAETVFARTPAIEKLIPALDTASVLAHESNSILKKRVIGRGDVDIAAMIQTLDNSDWVREGRTFFEANHQICPFCQQRTPVAFAENLSAYFDETFERDSKAIDELETNYKTDSARLQQEIESIIAAPSTFLGVEKMKSEKALLDSLIITNIQLLSVKKKEPSRSIDLESLANLASEVEALIDTTNGLILEHNKMVANVAQERRDLTAQVWKYLLEKELKANLAAYKTRRDALDKGINGIEAKIVLAKKDRGTTTAKLRALEKETTSIQPTIDAINALLSCFGFRGFSLSKADNGTCYKLVRPDGTDATETLSEGEMGFVTFLYFFHLLSGSNSESGMMTNRVVVFDDPVSSLDSDILFIVASLIKSLFDDVRAGTGHIKQVFVLTHNVYFHKEVSFNPRRRNKAMNEETFWIVRKSGLVSRLEKHTSNPISTSYELLWSQVRKPDRSNLAIQNTLRRILENYFRILGGVDPDKICAMFDGKEKLVCKSLFSWVNAGSHSAYDDLYLSIDDSMVETYLEVFRAVFKKAGHLAHYKMMMGEEYSEDGPAPISQ